MFHSVRPVAMSSVTALAHRMYRLKWGRNRGFISYKTGRLEGFHLMHLFLTAAADCCAHFVLSLFVPRRQQRVLCDCLRITGPDRAAGRHGDLCPALPAPPGGPPVAAPPTWRRRKRSLPVSASSDGREGRQSRLAAAAAEFGRPCHGAVSVPYTRFR